MISSSTEELKKKNSTVNEYLLLTKFEVLNLSEKKKKKKRSGAYSTDQEKEDRKMLSISVGLGKLRGHQRFQFEIDL